MLQELVEYKGQNDYSPNIAEYIGHNDIIPEFTLYFDVMKETEVKGHLRCRICGEAGIGANAGKLFFGYNTPKGLEGAVLKAIRHISTIHKSQILKKETVIEYINALPIGIIRHKTESKGKTFIALTGWIKYKPYQETQIKETEGKIEQLEELLNQQKVLLTQQRKTLDVITSLIVQDMDELGLIEEDITNLRLW